MIDDENFHRGTAGLEFQAQLLLKRGEQRDVGVWGCGGARAGSVVGSGLCAGSHKDEGEIEAALEAGRVDYGTAVDVSACLTTNRQKPPWKPRLP